MGTVPHVLVLNGPNLNMLGTREPEIYGAATLQDVERLCERTGREVGLSVTCRQSNHEGEMVGWIQESPQNFQGLVLNAGALSHTSISLLDALKAVALPVLEVHISNIFARESFRHHSYVSGVAQGIVSGFGVDGYAFALRRMASLLGVSGQKP